MLTKAELAEKIAQQEGISNTAAASMIETVVTAIADAAVEDGGVRFTGLFSIDVKTRSARTGKNPRTGEEIQIPESKSLHITTGKAIKEALNA